MPTHTGSIAFVAVVFVSGIVAGLQVDAVRAADDCLAAPNAQPPKGSHWYYHLDRASQRKCWHLRSQGQTTQQEGSQAAPDTTSTAKASSAPLSISPGDSVTPMPQAESHAVIRKTPTMNDADEPIGRSPQQGIARGARAQQAEQATTGTVAWPDPAQQVDALPRSELANPRVVRADATPERPAADVQAVGDAQKVDSTREPNGDSGGWADTLKVTPLGIVLIGGIGLAMAGLLSRAVVRIASARRRRVYVDRREPHWIDDLPAEPSPPFAAQPLDLAYAPVEHIGRDDEDVEAALRNLLRARDSRAA